MNVKRLTRHIREKHTIFANEHLMNAQRNNIENEVAEIPIADNVNTLNS